MAVIALKQKTLKRVIIIIDGADLEGKMENGRPFNLFDDTLENELVSITIKSLENPQKVIHHYAQIKDMEKFVEEMDRISGRAVVKPN
jgi:hypothetical protein